MAEKVLMKGNEAIAEAAIMANCRNFFGYPITPQTEVAAYMAKRMPKVGGAYLQAESEIAAINMVIGAAAAGQRVLTSSSSPGLSLKSEGISYLAGMDLPAVIINVQRGGPGLGGIQPAQSDYFQATRAAGHGDFHLLVFAPSTVQEVVDMIFTAFEKADTYRMPALILSDGILGQMMEPVIFPEGKEVKVIEKPWAACGTQGTRRKNILNSLQLEASELERQNIERFKKYDVIMETEPMWEEYLLDDAEIVIVSYGSSARISKNAINMAREQGIKVGLVRPITLWPFPKKVLAEKAKTARAFISAELSMGQMIEDVKLSINCSKPVYLANRAGGMVYTPKEILEVIIQADKEAK